MICKNCKNKIPDDEKTCPICGKVSYNDDFANKIISQKSELPLNHSEEEYTSTPYKPLNPDENCEESKIEFENIDKLSNIPVDMDFGNSTKYYYKKREKTVAKTRFEKFIEKYHPQKIAEPEEFIAAARRTTRISIFLDILSAITFFFGIFSAIGIILSVLSINFADNTKDYYNKDVRTENKSCFILKFLCRALFWLNFFMFLFSAYYQAFIGTGIGMLIGGKLR